MKRLTKTGESFIKTVCSGTSSNTLISGKYRYNLPLSDLFFVPTIFTADMKDRNGSGIGNNAQLGDELIYWFNKYAEDANIDANLLAAQAYVDSGYKAWHYDKINSGSGISNLPAIRIYSHIVNSETPTTFEGLNNSFIEQADIDKITVGLTNPTEELSYRYKGRGTTDSSIVISTSNREILHQNVIDNPEIIIKAQANLMKEILQRNKGITANALFAYKIYWLLSATSYPEMADNVGREYGETVLKTGLDYVTKVFRCLGDEKNDQVKERIDKPVGSWFGYDIDFTIDKFKAHLG